MVTVSGQFADVAAAVRGSIYIKNQFKDNSKVKVLPVAENYLLVDCPSDHVDVVAAALEEAGAIDVQTT